MISTADPKQSPSSEWIASVRERYPTHAAVDETLTRKLERRAGPPHRPQSMETVVERLQNFLAKRIDGKFSITDVRSLAGGSSKEQYGFSVHAGDGKPRRYVLRMRPAESIVETHAGREFQAINAVCGTMPVPRAHWLDIHGDELGQPALITDFCQGVTAPPYEGAYSPRLGLPEKYRRTLAPQFARYFGALACLDWSRCDMSYFDKPSAGTIEGVISSLNWWQRVWEEDSVEAYPLMTLAAHWLRKNAPPIDHISLVHSDFRKGNFLFDLDSGEITAILDWELAHLGDRHEDLAFFLNPLFGGYDEQGNYLVGGLMPREEFLDAYQHHSGLPVDEKKLDYYMIFNAWRGVVNTLATGVRCMLGQKTHQDIRVGWITYTSAISLQTLLEDLERRLRHAA